MHGYITPQVCELVDTEVMRGVKIAKRVREVMDLDIIGVVQDYDGFWFEVPSHLFVPEYCKKYLSKLISRKLNLKYLEY